MLTTGRDGGFHVLLALVLVDLVFVGLLVVYPDLPLNYPFASGDAHDWISNGLYLAGHDVRYSVRPPLLPALIAVLSRIEALDFLPLLMQILVHSVPVGLYLLLRANYDAALSFFVSLAWMFTFSWRALSLEIGADVSAACLLFWSAYHWHRTGRRPFAYVTSAFFAALSSLTQQLALLVPVPVLATSLRFRRADIRSKAWIAGATIFTLANLLWWAWKYVAFGTTGDVLAANWSLLTIRGDGISFYGWSFLSFLGWPASIMIAVGVARMMVRARHEAWPFYLVIAWGAILVFFACFYDYNSKRFIAYVFPLSGLLLGEGLATLRTTAARAIALACVLAWCITPLPGNPADPNRTVLWPLPPVYARVQIESEGAFGRIAEPLHLEIETSSLADALKLTPEYRLISHRLSAMKTPSVDPKAAGEARAAIVLYDDRSLAGERYAIVSRVGVLLRKRVQFLPASAFTDETFWTHATAAPAGQIDNLRMDSIEIEGIAGTWLVARPGGAVARQDSGLPSRGKSDRAVIEAASRIATAAGEGSIAVFLDPGLRDRWRLYLPFLVRTTELIYVEPEQVQSARALLREAEVLDPTVYVDGTAITRLRWSGRTWTVIEEQGSDSIY